MSNLDALAATVAKWRCDKTAIGRHLERCRRCVVEAWLQEARQGAVKAEDEAVRTLLAGVPPEGGSATRETMEQVVRAAFRGGLAAQPAKGR
jgi:hypothetical protein